MGRVRAGCDRDIPVDLFGCLFCGMLVPMFESQEGVFGIEFFTTKTSVYSIGLLGADKF